MTELMSQSAPYPQLLADLVPRVGYKQGWTFRLEDLDRGQGSTGLTLSIQVLVTDSYHPEMRIAVRHLMPVPPAAYDEPNWVRWLFEQIRLVETHEASEFFLIDGARPYAPLHGPGNDPYVIRELATDEARRTSFRGELR